jgi:Uncharacterised protein (DUF2406)
MFRRRSKETGEPIMSQRRSYTQREPEHIKNPSNDIHDPILSAIRDAQPFEISNEGTTVSMSPQGRTRDLFGNVIMNPDHSNPSRPRDERPLDTIRSFEYSYTGDERLRDEMETPRLGWSTRRDFQTMPRFEENPYAPHPTNNVISLSGAGTAVNNTQYNRPLPTEPVKKKRGLFGRKKN